MPKTDYDLDSLSDGIARMPRRLSARERVTDHVFFFLQVFSWFCFLIGGIIGWAKWGWMGGVALAAAGWVFGMWIRHSLGRRGSDPTLGFYERMRERANGSRRGILEWLIETLRGSGFTVTKCRAITTAYQRAVQRLQATANPAEHEAILRQLDSEVKRISYSDSLS